MKHAIALIKEYFEEKDVKFLAEDDMIQAGFTVKNGPFIICRFISRDDDNDVAFRIFHIQNVEEEKLPAFLKVINEINHNFRYLRFVVDKDNDVNVEYDLPVDTPDSGVGPMCFELFCRSMNIVEEAYSMMMQALWRS